MQKLTKEFLETIGAGCGCGNNSGGRKPGRGNRKSCVAKCELNNQKSKRQQNCRCFCRCVKNNKGAEHPQNCALACERRPHPRRSSSFVR